MFGISYGELFLLIGATAALVGPKDLPRIARAAGRLAGRSIGYVQLARGQFDNVMQQSQARQVHKELQDALAQLESIRYEVRSISLMNPGPMTRKLIDNIQDPAPLSSGTNISLEKPKEERKSINSDSTLRTSNAPNFHSQATAYAKLAESDAVKAGTLKSGAVKDDLYDESGLFIVLPISAESTGMLPNRKENVKGSDLVLEAVVEAEVARNAKDFFSQPENQIQGTEK
ncbi:sec-independent protein translocase protein TatB isoform X2 [Pyrus x bretschneideri]|uniref:sec-independent protein translocase protein TatB isoform X2 n=1 Tax=Pyrus x bretschneideri TaxID=225117 RepID=UPI002030F45C|nr:sec-independent protein translocase protein TatB isoform X2 [Pyrus x bretschneideri]